MFPDYIIKLLFYSILISHVACMVVSIFNILSTMFKSMIPYITMHHTCSSQTFTNMFDSNLMYIDHDLLFKSLQGISEDTMHLYMHPSVDIISRGSLTQGTYVRSVQYRTKRSCSRFMSSIPYDYIINLLF